MEVVWVLLLWTLESHRMSPYTLILNYLMQLIYCPALFKPITDCFWVWAALSQSATVVLTWPLFHWEKIQVFRWQPEILECSCHCLIPLSLETSCVFERCPPLRVSRVDICAWRCAHLYLDYHRRKSISPTLIRVTLKGATSFRGLLTWELGLFVWHKWKFGSFECLTHQAAVSLFDYSSLNCM